jgi:MFS family permease
MAKKKLKATQKKKLYKVASKGAFAGEFVSISTPYVVMGAINYEEWFKGTEGWKVGLGGSLALALMGIAILLVKKNKEDKESSLSGYITLLLGWLAVAFVFLLLANIMHQIASIMFFGAIGIAGALGLDIVSTNCDKQAKEYELAIKKIRGERLENQVRREIEQEVIEEDRNVKF